MSMADMVTARRPAPRILRADGHRGGRAVVRRAARRPRRHRRRAQPRGARRSAGGSTTGRWRAGTGARRRRFEARRSRSSTDAALARRGRAGARQHARRRSSWLDDARADARARAVRRRRTAGRGAGGRRRPGARSTGATAAAAGAIRVGAETLDRLTVLARLGDRARPGRAALACSRRWRRCGGSSMATAATRARIAASLRSSAGPLGDRRLADRGERRVPRAGARVARADAARHPGRLAVRRSGPAGSSRGTTGYAVGAAVAAPRPLHARRIGCSSSTTATCASLGADPDALGIALRRPAAARPAADPGRLHDRHGRLGGRPAGRRAWTPRPPWVFATYETGGLGNLVELLHESGHALHAAAVRTRPAFLESTEADAPSSRATADVLGWDATEPAWQRRWLGDGRRRRARPSSIATAR